ncbi:unnamed protein product [Symbiodinium sp. KB8]|nr:unnamed protein product [Symbiodinium sp. KB8]
MSPMPEEGEGRRHPETQLGIQRAQTSTTTTCPTSPHPLSKCRSGDNEDRLNPTHTQKIRRGYARLPRLRPRMRGDKMKNDNTYLAAPPPTIRGGRHEQRGHPGTPSSIRRARSQASALLASISSETQAAAEYAPNAEDLGHQERADYAAEALTLITGSDGASERCGGAGSRRLPRRRGHEAIAASRSPDKGDRKGGRAAKEGIRQLLELVQAGGTGATYRRNGNGPHWGELAEAEPQVENMLPRLRNLLDEAATGVGVLVGIYPHRGDAENIHPVDVIAQQGTA